MPREDRGAGTAIRLVVNADDYAYYRCVSRGILDAIRAGAVTATGMITTGELFPELALLLAEAPEVDCGVHLNLTWGRALAPAMRAKLPDGGAFPGKGAMAKAILLGQIRPAVLREEWTAQVERALETGIPIRFLNSHEHIHLLPTLRRIMEELAARYRIPYLRRLLPDWRHGRGGAARVRNLAASLFPSPRGSEGGSRTIPCLGLGASGRIDLAYLRGRLSQLRSGGVYELMCHPGHDDTHEVTDPGLRHYHAWEQELAVLGSPECHRLYRELGIEIIRFRDLAEAPSQ
jgi:predicted glycoside hydrolase/deacetylase ChbG (UPF0249 family)